MLRPLLFAALLVAGACTTDGAQPTVRFPNGETYTGEMQGALRSGQGVYTWPDGRRYVGSFRDGLPHGRGTYSFPNGERYVGDFVENRRTGQGTYTWRDGRTYVGAFRDDQPNGRGTYSWPDGRRQVGEFRDGEFLGDGATPAATAASAGPRAQVAAGSGEVAMRPRGGTFTVPVSINGGPILDFFLDSGAADVSVPAHAFDALKRAGSIRNEDIIGRETYLMPNGSTKTSVVFRIRSVTVGSVTVENVRGSVADYAGPPLLGMSFLSRFASWSVDNERHVPVLR